MIEQALSAPEFCLRVLQRKIDELGDAAFANTGTVILYSGPARYILSQTSGMDSNVVRSERLAKLLNATRIDETPIGNFLATSSLFDYFYQTTNDVVEARSSVNEVWIYASRQFARAKFKAAVTAVCGADPDRTFRAHELKVILTEKIPLEAINDVAMQHYRDTYVAHGGGEPGFYAAYVEVCKTELEFARLRSENAPDDLKKMAREDYEACKLFFELEQAEMSRITAKTTLVNVTAQHDAIIAEEPDRPVDNKPASSSVRGAAHGN